MLMLAAGSRLACAAPCAYVTDTRAMLEGGVDPDNEMIWPGSLAKGIDYVDMLAGIAPVLAARKDRFILVSMAAGLTMDQIRAMAGGEYPVLRIMPNTPAALGCGMILMALDERITGEDRDIFVDGLSAAGRFDELPEHLIDAGSAVSGCGPAFLYMFIEALADGGVAVGLPRAKAQDYAAQMALGAARMVLESGQHPGALKDAVCSPGGSTIMGVKALEDGGFRGAVMNAVLDACRRTKELGK